MLWKEKEQKEEEEGLEGTKRGAMIFELWWGVGKEGQETERKHSKTHYRGT